MRPFLVQPVDAKGQVGLKPHKAQAVALNLLRWDWAMLTSSPNLHVLVYC